ncbi:MAG TPA: group II truncated hemoglobin [Galbitalea sp.]
MMTIYDAAGGAAGMTRLATAWHVRAIADDVVAHAFSHGFREDHIERLADYWTEALGGPALYSSKFGSESFVVREHSGHGEHVEMDDRAIDCFDQALVDVGLDADPRLAKVLHDYFEWATRRPMAEYPRDVADVPDGLAFPRWSWDGLVAAAG